MRRGYILTRLKLEEGYCDAEEDKLAHRVLILEVYTHL